MDIQNNTEFSDEPSEAKVHILIRSVHDTTNNDVVIYLSEIVSLDTSSQSWKKSQKCFSSDAPIRDFSNIPIN